MNTIEVVDLKKYYTIKSPVLKVTRGIVKAVNGISFHIEEGETLGLVGESGSGKTTTGKMILRLLEPTAGKVFYKGEDISKIGKGQFRKLRKDLQVVFQNPYAALDTRMTIADILTEPLAIHHMVSPLEYQKEVLRLLEIVGLSSRHRERFPHELSGGQRQRVGIARALATNPQFIVCDEPVSALDVSVQSQILNLLIDLQREYKISYLFVGHDLNVVKHVSDRIAVMYLGKIIEMGKVEDIFSRPKHPYTKALIASAPKLDPDTRKEKLKIQGEIPSLSEYPEGCVFHTRCPSCMEVCRRLEPTGIDFNEGHWAVCHLYHPSPEQTQSI